MKKVIMMMLLSVSLQMPAQNVQKPDTAKFMNQYRSFVGMVDRDNVISKGNYARIDSAYHMLTNQYRQIKPYLSDAQVGEYNTLKGRYTRRLMQYRGDRVASGLEATGDTLMRKTSRARKAVGGWLDGLFGGK